MILSEKELTHKYVYESNFYLFIIILTKFSKDVSNKFFYKLAIRKDDNHNPKTV